MGERLPSSSDISSDKGAKSSPSYAAFATASQIGVGTAA